MNESNETLPSYGSEAEVVQDLAEELQNDIGLIAATSGAIPPFLEMDDDVHAHCGLLFIKVYFFKLLLIIDLILELL